MNHKASRWYNIAKKTVKTVLAVLAVFFVLTGTAVALIQNKQVQHYLINELTLYFSEKLGVDVQIASVDLAFVNKISLRQVYLEDQQGDTLFFVNRIDLGIKLLPLFHKRVICNNVELYNPYGRLLIDKQNRLNATFLIDAFKSDKPSQSKFSFEIDNIKIRDLRFSFDNENFAPAPEKFDARHIAVNDFDADIVLRELDLDKQIVQFGVKSLSFKEQSGFRLKNLSLSTTAEGNKISINNLNIELPNSQLNFLPISCYLDSLQKKDLTKAQFDVGIASSEIMLYDLQAFVPAFNRLREKTLVTAEISGSLADLKIKNLQLSYDDALSVAGDFTFAGLPNLNNTFVHAQLNNISTNRAKLQDMLSDIKATPVMLPEQLEQLGNLHYSGTVLGFISNMAVNGKLRSRMGVLNTDIRLKVLPNFDGVDYNGSLNAEHLNTALLFGDSTTVDDVSLKISSEGSIRPNNNIEGKIEGLLSSMKFKNYNYNNIAFDGKFNSTDFTGKVSLNDPNAELAFDGKLSLAKKMPVGNFHLSVKHLRPYQLNLIKKYKDLNVAFEINTNFSGKAIDKVTTNVLIDELRLSNREQEIAVNKIYLKSEITDTISRISIDSDLLSGEARGRFSFSDLAQNLRKEFYHYLPSLEKEEKTNKQKPTINDFVFHFSHFELDSLAAILDMKVKVSPQTSIAGFLNDSIGKFRLELTSPELRFNKQHFKNLRLICDNPDQAIMLSLISQLGRQSRFELTSQVANDSLLLHLNLTNPGKISGDVHVQSHFEKNEQGISTAEINILPSKLMIKDAPWDIQKGLISTDFKALDISNLSLEHDQQFIKIRGRASSSPTDTVFVKLQDFQLAYLLNLVRVTNPKMESLVTGWGRVSNVFGKMMLELNVLGKHFSFNDCLWGDTKLRSKWDGDTKLLTSNGVIVNGADTVGKIDGSYYPPGDSLDFAVIAKGLKIDFLRPYFSGILDSVSGSGSGKIKILGKLKTMLFDGDVAINNGKFTVSYLKTSYSFSDTVHLRPKEISFRNIKVYDSEKHQGVFSGQLSHSFFKNMRYNFNIECNDLLALNTTVHDNPDFYGRAYGTGRVRIQGEPGKINFNINVRSEAGTHITIPIAKTAVASSNSFIQFVKKDDEPQPKRNRRQQVVVEPTPPTNMNLTMQLEATPDAQIKLLIDPVGGDMVSATGNGNMRIEYNSGGLKMYGSYEVEQGEYMFTLQQVVRKNFSIRQGGNIQWTGNPYQATIALDAIYTIPSVSLFDIMDEDEILSRAVPRSNVPVNCLLRLTGDLTKPNITFDIELPSDPETQRRVKSIVSTEEMMNREFLALLVMNRFYKPEYLQNTRSDFNSDMVSVLASTVSGQLNSWLGQMSDKFSVGLNARLGSAYAPGSEYEVALMYQPNSRLVINSNLGYRDDMLYNTTGSNFVGDVDIEYKLNRSGKLRAKAYSHSADAYYLNTMGAAKTTQGVGLLYREDFNSFSKLINQYFARKATKKPDTTGIRNDSIITKK
ncbi:MAG: translocation/assembly module TamB domain-containing protein [Prevotellaceae bacterium]|nr:translocation/assembly module TamB domain-containing protein [Prevotellaceae bacterium]